MCGRFHALKKARCRRFTACRTRHVVPSLVDMLQEANIIRFFSYGRMLQGVPVLPEGLNVTVRNQQSSQSAAFGGYGREMGALIRAHDSEATSLGPIDSWPQSLKTLIDLMLGSVVASYCWRRHQHQEHGHPVL